MLPRSTLLLALLLAAGAPATTADPASPDDGLPVLREGRAPGSGWAAVSFEAEGGAVAFEQWIHGHRSAGLQAGFLLFEGRREVVAGNAVTVAALRDGISVRSTLLNVSEGMLTARFDESFLNAGAAWSGEGERLDGEHTLLVWGVGAPAQEWRWRLSGEDVKILDVRTGREAALLLSGDLEGLAAFDLRGGDVSVYRQAVLGGEVLVGGVIDVQVEERLVALFDTFDGPGVHLLSVRGPTDATTSCPCFLRDERRGDYSFRVDQVAAVVPGSSGEVFLSLVDYELPE